MTIGQLLQTQYLEFLQEHWNGVCEVNMEHVETGNVNEVCEMGRIYTW